LWWLYTRFALPIAGYLVGNGWGRVGRFLGPSIDEFWSRNSLPGLVEIWEAAGIGQVRWEQMSLGGGVVIWGVRT
jgi:demethylmenaquinone methyltransferase/2-methoxy-6-polyprenyl-1,4-benzoquinol methylase